MSGYKLNKIVGNEDSREKSDVVFNFFKCFNYMNRFFQAENKKALIKLWAREVKNAAI